MNKRDIEKYGNWYFKAHHMIMEKFGKDSKLFCKFLAACSPRKQVLANWRMAHKQFYHHKYGCFGSIAGVLPAHIRNLERIKTGVELSGPKVTNFYKNLTGDWNAVTVDSWVARYFGYSDKLTPKQYQKCVHRIKRIARYHKVKPCQVQATAWCLQLIKSGRSIKEFGCEE